MNKLIQLILSLATVSAIPTLRAGDVVVPAKALLQEATFEATGYVFAYGGWSLGPSIEGLILNPENTGESAPYGADFDDGFIVGFGSGIYSDLFGGSRFELEALSSSVDYNSLTLDSFGDLPVQGELKTQGLFLNVLKEFPLGNATAYAGGGLGIGTLESSIITVIPGGGVVGGVQSVNSKNTVLAYQLKAGIDIPISDRVAIFGEYKLIGLSDSSDTFLIFPQETDGFVSSHFVVGGRVSF